MSWTCRLAERREEEEAHLGLWVDASVVLHEDLCDRYAVLLCGEVKRREAVTRGMIHVSGTFQKQSDHVRVAILGGQVQRREPVLRRIETLVKKYL